MSETKFTPGPWTAVKGYWPDKGEYWMVFHEQGPQLSSRSQDHKVEFTEANAHLIAAAPELYEALKGLVEMAEAHRQDDGSINGPWDRAVAALAKARGESQ